MSRSVWKGVIKEKENKEKIIERNRTIVPEDVGKTVKIKTGLFKDEKNYKNIIITTRHIGHKYGEYAITKQPAIYKKNTKGKK